MPEYVRITDGEPLPDIAGFAPFRAVVVLAAPYSDEWQEAVSDWLVASGCLYMMAWGPDCSSWDDSVDFANLRQFDYGEIPDDRFVMTTWHDDEPLSDVFWYAEHCACHDTVDLGSTLIVDISKGDRKAELMRAFEQAQADR